MFFEYILIYHKEKFNILISSRKALTDTKGIRVEMYLYQMLDLIEIDKKLC